MPFNRFFSGLLVLGLSLAAATTDAAGKNFQVRDGNAVLLMDAFELMGAEKVSVTTGTMMFVRELLCAYEPATFQERALFCTIEFQHSDDSVSRLKPRDRKIIEGIVMVVRELRLSERADTTPLRRPVIRLQDVLCEQRGPRTNCRGIDKLAP